MSGPGARLREAMANEMVLAPFVYDGFTALIAQGQGARAVEMTGHGTAAQRGLPGDAERPFIGARTYVVSEVPYKDFPSPAVR